MEQMQMGDSQQQSVELYLSCRNLKDLDFFGKSDPKVKVFLQSNGHWSLIGETETIMNNLNPDFKTRIKLAYFFETKQPLRFEVYDVDKNSSDEFIGSVESSVGEIMGSRKQTVILDLHDKKSKKATGKLVVRGDKAEDAKNMISWQWSGIKLMNTDGIFGKSDPFLRFFKEKNGDWLLVHQTEFIKNNLNPVWKPFKIDDDHLCGGEHNHPIRVEVWDDQTDGNHRYIGVFDITLERLKNGENTFQCYNAKKKKETGTIKLQSFTIEKVEPKICFLDYIRGGEQLNTIVAIDFTGSNGHPKDAGSLHEMFTDGRLNEYQQAISTVCQIVLNYDYDQMIPAFGFGACLNYDTLSDSETSHCFPLSGVPDKSEVLGLQGLMDVYRYALDHVQLSGPTVFAPILKEALKVAEFNKQNETDIYTIFMILTDGAIDDMQETVDLIVNGTGLPLSVIIVGVGSSSFGNMRILDGDSGLKNSAGKKAARDLVQFVPFRDFKNDMVQLAREVLAEIPNQLVEYKALVGKKPKPKIN